MQSHAHVHDDRLGHQHVNGHGPQYDRQHHGRVRQLFHYGDEGQHRGQEVVAPDNHLTQQESTCSARKLVADAFFDRVATCAAIQVTVPAPLADKELRAKRKKAAAASAEPTKVTKTRTPNTTTKQKEDAFFWIFDADVSVKDAASSARQRL